MWGNLLSPTSEKELCLQQCAKTFALGTQQRRVRTETACHRKSPWEDYECISEQSETSFYRRLHCSAISDLFNVVWISYASTNSNIQSILEVKFKKCAGSFEHCKVVLIPISQIFVGLFLPCYVSASS